MKKLALALYVDDINDDISDPCTVTIGEMFRKLIEMKS